MGSYSEEEEDLFHDAPEEMISSELDCNSEVSEDCDESPELIRRVDYWTSYPESVQTRRHRFLEFMGLSCGRGLNRRDDSDEDLIEEIAGFDFDRTRECGGAVFRAPDSAEVSTSNQSSVSNSSNQVQGLTQNGTLEDNVDKVESSDERMFVRTESGQSTLSFSLDGLQKSSGSPLITWQDSQREIEMARDFVGLKKRMKEGLLRKLGVLTGIVHRYRETSSESNDGESVALIGQPRKVRVQSCKKQFKELSSLYIDQEFTAHRGSILTMKFSRDGQYLASAGEDGVVRIWRIMEEERGDRVDIPETCPSCLLFSMNHLSQLSPLDADNGKLEKTKRWKKTADSTCVILPPKVFQIAEKPLHEFKGHKAEILDLSWSRNGLLLSSSVDGTVRLWELGCDTCKGVFPHSNYVTCVAFNPVDDHLFISGSIDGKVRIWSLLHCRVVDYTDIREIVTAVCYRPDGKGIIVGSMAGNCRFYSLKEDQLQLDAELSLQGKKKLPGKRVTGFQFSPNDLNKLMVTCADSHVRILCGLDVVCKLKASSLRAPGSQTFATFTSDGKHIVSKNEDSNIYVWNYAGPEKAYRRKARNIQSCESFFSHNTSIAIPWCGMETVRCALPSPSLGMPESGHGLKPACCPSDCFSLARGFLLDSLVKGSVTWPEEKLLETSQARGVMCRSKLKFLKNACQHMLSSAHSWGLVIVAATWDGRIRAYHNYGLPVRI